MTFSIGVDIGGTKIAAALVDTSTGAIRACAKVATPPSGSTQSVLDTIRAVIASLKAPVGLPIGIGVCEFVDNARVIQSSYSVDLKHIDLGKALKDLGEITVGSDVRAGAIAEFAFGAARGSASTFYVSAGTGISSCMLLNGVPLTGAHGMAIVLGAPPVEIVASGRSLDHRRKDEKFSEDQFRDKIKEAGQKTGQVVATLANALDPELIVIGGGLGISEPFFSSLADTVHLLTHKDVPSPYRVVPAELGADSGVIGAALLTCDDPNGINKGNH